jgi:hypothetical protein
MIGPYMVFFLHRTKFYKQIEKFLKNQIICVRVTLLGRCIVRYTIFKEYRTVNSPISDTKRLL